MERRYEKLLISLRYYLIGRRYHTALKALDFAQKIHTGTRKDGKTPEFQHQVEMALYITTLKDLINEEETITCALLHDVVEDYPAFYNEMSDLFPQEIMATCMSLNNTDKDKPNYYKMIQTDSIASIVKGADRIHNVGSMVGVFTKEKQKKYVEEIEQFILPMLKQARDKFPEQILAYFNIMTILRSQVGILKPNWIEESK